jgi:hypothetical protein
MLPLGCGQREEPILADAPPQTPQSADPATGSGLFDQYPTTDRYALASGVVCDVPFRCADGDELLLLGVADLSDLTEMLAGQGYYPVATADGKGIVSLWVGDYRDTSIGPYHEMALTVVAAKTHLTVSHGSPFDLLAAAANPAVVNFVQRLYLDQQVPIDYGREVNGLPKYKAPQPITYTTTGSRWQFGLSVDGHPAINGDVLLPAGPGTFVQLAVPVVSSTEINQTTGLMIGEAALRVGLFDASDTLQFHAGSAFGKALHQMHFTPQIVEYLPNFRFVLPKPTNWLPATP